MIKNYLFATSFFLVLIFINACVDSTPEKLPFIGQSQIVNRDTLFYKIPAFQFVNQDSVIISNSSLSEGIYVADFFFTYCPTICPKVKTQMLRVYEKYKTDDRVRLVSHTLDPKRDNAAVLKNYAKKLDVDTDKWLFLTGEKDDLREMAMKYFIAASDNPEAPGGIVHSGKIILVDNEGHVRAFAEGTDEEEVTRFLEEIDVLLEE